MLGLQKMFSFLSFLPPIFHFKIHKRCGTFFERERVNSLKRTYFEGGGTCKTNKGGGTGGQKLEILSEVLFEYPHSQRYFIAQPHPNSLLR